MSEPRRLLDGPLDLAEATFLRSAADDVPPPTSRQAVALRLGLTPSPPPAAPPPVPALGGGAGLKVVAAAALGAVLALGASLALHGRRASTPVKANAAVGSPTATPAIPAAVPLPGPAPSAAPQDRGAPGVDLPAAEPPGPSPRLHRAAASTTAPPAASTPPAASPPASPAASASLAAEIASLDEVRRALAEPDPVRALRLLDDHAVAFPLGRLVPEAHALRVEALVAAGERDRAEVLARELIAAQPDSPAAARVKRLLGRPLGRPLER